jgi:hypothetical protein
LLKRFDEEIGFRWVRINLEALEIARLPVGLEAWAPGQGGFNI